MGHRTPDVSPRWDLLVSPLVPTAYAVGSILLPLRGCRVEVAFDLARFCRGLGSGWLWLPSLLRWADGGVRPYVGRGDTCSSGEL